MAFFNGGLLQNWFVFCDLKFKCEEICLGGLWKVCASHFIKCSAGVLGPDQNHWVMLLDCCGAESLREVRTQPASKLWTIQTISSPTKGLVPAMTLLGGEGCSDPAACQQRALQYLPEEAWSFEQLLFGGLGSSSFQPAVWRSTSFWIEQLLEVFICLTGVSWFRWCGCCNGGFVGSGWGHMESQTSSKTSRKLKFGIFHVFLYQLCGS